MHWLSNTIELYRAMGALRFTIFMLGLTALLVGYVAPKIWLDKQVGWPDAYGFHCSGRGCIFIELVHSPDLLKTGATYELLLFAWMWMFPLFLLVLLSFSLVIVGRRKVKQYRNRIRPLKD